MNVNNKNVKQFLVIMFPQSQTNLDLNQVLGVYGPLSLREKSSITEPKTSVDYVTVQQKFDHILFSLSISQ